jgi:predicted metallopeptidase
LLDEKGKQKAFTETKDLIKDHLESIELFNGNKIFNIALFVPCVITYINKNKSSVGIECLDKINDIQLVYDNIYQINKYSDKFIYISLKDKIKNIKIDNLWNKYKNDNKLKDYMISFTGIRGNVNLKTDDSMVQKDFYTIVSVERKPQISTEVVGDSFLKFYFKNELECNNFLNYLKTNFVRFLLSIYKNNQNLHRGELSIIPWLDFTQEWTDEKLYIEFNLTEEEIKFIEKNIPKYY